MKDYDMRQRFSTCVPRRFEF